MQTQEKVVVDDRALIGWYMLTVPDRAKVTAALEGPPRSPEGGSAVASAAL